MNCKVEPDNSLYNLFAMGLLVVLSDYRQLFKEGNKALQHLRSFLPGLIPNTLKESCK